MITAIKLVSIWLLIEAVGLVVFHTLFRLAKWSWRYIAVHSLYKFAIRVVYCLMALFVGGMAMVGGLIWILFS